MCTCIVPATYSTYSLILRVENLGFYSPMITRRLPSQRR
jgi:hypothetical protein